MEGRIGKEIARGAEADVYRTEFLGRDAVLKVRPPKKYRQPDLDKRIRTARMRSEARLIRSARTAGVCTPVIYDIDTGMCSITMEYLHGITVKRFLDTYPERASGICRRIGQSLARLHNGKMSHGDLTTSNMIVTDDGNVFFIDFSMGASLVDVEEMGVDMHLLERAFSSAHPDLNTAYKALMDAYCDKKTDAQQVLDKIQEIKERGRYT